jgi:hypothetical protein
MGSIAAARLKGLVLAAVPLDAFGCFACGSVCVWSGVARVNQSAGLFSYLSIIYTLDLNHPHLITPVEADSRTGGLLVAASAPSGMNARRWTFAKSQSCGWEVRRGVSVVWEGESMAGKEGGQATHTRHGRVSMLL